MDDALSSATEPAALTLMPEVAARLALPGHALTFLLLAPPYPALGVGALRVLRISEGSDGTELVAGYDRYERFERAEPPA